MEIVNYLEHIKHQRMEMKSNVALPKDENEGLKKENERLLEENRRLKESLYNVDS